MTTLTDMVAAVVVHSSTAAFSHFGVTLERAPEPVHAVAPAESHVVARSPQPTIRLQRAQACRDAPHAVVVKA